MNGNQLANSMEQIPLKNSVGQKLPILWKFITRFETAQHDPQIK